MIYGNNNSAIPAINAIKQSVNLYTYCVNNPLSFIDPTGLDLIWITAENSAPFAGTTLGHTSAIVQDKTGDWFYFYWGPDHALLEKVDNFTVDGIAYEITALGDIGNFNLWIDTAMRDKLKDEGTDYKGTSSYTHSVYIEGDFTKSYDYYKSIVGKYNSAGKAPNTEYDQFFKNCLTQVNIGFSKTSWENIATKNNGEYSFYSNYGALTPNSAHKFISSFFGNLSFKKPYSKAMR